MARLNRDDLYADPTLQGTPFCRALTERFDRWLDLHGAMQRIDAGQTDDGFFGASEAGSDSLLGELDEMVRGGDRPRKERSTAESAAAGNDGGTARRG